MKYNEVLFFTSTNNNYWSKGTTFNKSVGNLKDLTSKCEFVVYMTTDMGAYIDDISGGVCSSSEELTQFIGKFRLSGGRLTSME